MSKEQLLSLLGTTVVVFVGFVTVWGAFAANNRPAPFVVRALTVVTGIASLILGTLFALPSAPASPANPTIKSDNIRAQIFAANDDATITSIISGLWYEDDSGATSNNLYNPNGCPTKGYGMAWNVSHQNIAYKNRIIAFTKEMQLQFLDGGWFVRVCLREGVDLSALDAARIQAAVMQRSKDNKDGVVWEAQAIEQ